jgi:predicted nucleotidyltransferase
MISDRHISNVLRAYREGLEKLFRDQFVGVLIYGSFARGKARPDSDVDVLCVLRAPFDYAEAIRRSSELTARLSLEYDVVLSRVFASEDDVKTCNLPSFMDVRRDGIPA